MMLRRGSRGDDVVALQRALAAAGFRVPQTGFYGDITERAVQDYQRQRGLRVDGVVGPQTMAALQPPVPRPNPARAPAEMPATVTGGGGQGADALVGLVMTPQAPAAAPAYDPLSSVASPNTFAGHQIETMGNIQAQRNRMDQGEVQAGREPIFSPGWAQNMPMASGAYPETANSPFADPGMQSYVPPQAPPMPGYNPLASIQPPQQAVAPAQPAGLGDAVVNTVMPAAMRLIDLFQARGGGSGR